MGVRQAVPYEINAALGGLGGSLKPAGQGLGIGEAVAAYLMVEPFEAFKDEEISHGQSPCG
jgi:hypothetical protein